MSEYIKIPRDRAKKLLAEIDAGTSPIPEHLQPVFEIVACGGADLIMVPQTKEKFRAKHKHTLTLIGDDFLTSKGPSAFDKASLRRAIKSAHGVAIVSCAAVPSVYAGTALAAAAGHPSVLIETTMQHELEWIEFVQKHHRGVPILVATEKQTAQ